VYAETHPPIIWTGRNISLDMQKQKESSKIIYIGSYALKMQALITFWPDWPVASPDGQTGTPYIADIIKLLN